MAFFQSKSTRVTTFVMFCGVLSLTLMSVSQPQSSNEAEEARSYGKA